MIKKKKIGEKKFFLDFFVSPDVVWNFNPGWSRDHAGLYGFSMFGGQKNFFLIFFFFFLKFFSTIFLISGILLIF